MICLNKLSHFIGRFSKVLLKKSIRLIGLNAVNNLKYASTRFSFENNIVNRLFSPKLVYAYLELTNNCNLSCEMCIYKKMHEKTGYMSKSLFARCLKQFSKMRLNTLYLHFGGESLLHPHFNKFLKHAIQYRDNGTIGKIGWIDNGMLLNKSVSNLIVDLQVDSIGISIDGVGKVNDDIRKGSTYSTIEKNIKYLIRRRGNAKKPEVYLSMCDYGKTEEQIMDVYRAWIPIVDSITLIPSILPNNTVANKESIYRNHKLVKSPPFCFFPFETIAVSWDGKVTGCCSDYSFKMNLGAPKENSLEQIWNNEKYLTWRKNLIANTFPAESPCNECEFWKINFQPKVNSILNGKAVIKYGHIYRTIQRSCKD